MSEKIQSFPNVILVITDDQGYGELGCHGNSIIKTPNIDKLYYESIHLTNFHVGPTCAPARAGLLTGRYCNCTGVWHTIMGRSLLRANEVTMADIFKANGYKTALFGKWHLGDNYPFRPHDRGFEVALYHGGGGVSQTPDYWGNDYFDDTYFLNGKEISFNGYCTDVWFDEAIKFIENNKNHPFFCYLSTNAPHAPYNVADSYSDPYRGKVPGYRANFYGMITNIDDNMAKLRAKLKTLGIENNTILIWMTDNGTSAGCRVNRQGFVLDGYNAGMRGMKAWEYEGGHRVPFFIFWPDGGFTEGRDVGQLTAHIDILPTLIELCGIKITPHPKFSGISLVPLLSSKNENWPERVIVTDSQRVEYPIKWRKSSTMTNRWRLINGVELYEIIADPGQRNDVAKDHPEVVQELRKHYEKWWELVSTTFDEDCPIIIGSEHEKISRLTTHDWHGKFCAWHQRLIRQGITCNGYWIIEISEDGNYELELRRWPKEEDRAITEGIPGELTGWSTNSLCRKFISYQGGNALAFKKARIKIGEEEQSCDIDPKRKSIKFLFNLQSGITRLKTYLNDVNSDPIGSYYVYIKRLS
jgi:arylsulfatase A-like enzyme